MGITLRICALALAAATAAVTADPDAQELFDRAREKVLDNARRMPRYTCVENITRTQYQPAVVSPSKRQLVTRVAGCYARQMGGSRGDLLLRGRLRLDVTVVRDGEIFSWAGAGKFETADVGELVGDGASGSGEFGSFLASVFGSAPDEVRYAGLRNSLALFEYNVPVATSNYRLHMTGPARTIGFHGTFSVDPSDGDVQQLVVESGQFDQTDRICSIRHVMDYGRLKIGSGDFLLPEVSTMDAIYRNGQESLNETRYSDCREYVGESTIRFDDADASFRPAASKAVLQPLPSNVRLLIGLSKPIDTETAAAGDPVEGVLLRDVPGKQGALARINDHVHGRILRLQQYMEPPTPRWIVAIRFDTVERDGMTEPIALKPIDDGDRSAQCVRGPVPVVAYQRPKDAGVFVFSEHGNIVLDRRFISEWETR